VKGAYKEVAPRRELPLEGLKFKSFASRQMVSAPKVSGAQPQACPSLRTLREPTQAHRRPMGTPAALLLLAGLGLVAAPAAAGAVPRYQARALRRRLARRDH